MTFHNTDESAGSNAQTEGLVHLQEHADSHSYRPVSTPSRLGGRSLRPVAAIELVNVIAAIVQTAHVHHVTTSDARLLSTWTSPCGEVTIERRETAHDELRFFEQNPDDYYTEYTLSFRNYLVFAYRDLVWTSVRTPTRHGRDSTEDIPETCWNILSQELRSREQAREDTRTRRKTDQRSTQSRRTLGTLLRAV